MSEMVERVRQALRKAGLDNPIWEEEALARAAIEAMREPTEKMIDAGAEGSGEDSTACALGAWEAMIDEALATPSPAIPADTPEQSQ